MKNPMIVYAFSILSASAAAGAAGYHAEEAVDSVPLVANALNCENITSSRATLTAKDRAPCEALNVAFKGTGVLLAGSIGGLAGGALAAAFAHRRRKEAKAGPEQKKTPQNRRIVQP